MDPAGETIWATQKAMASLFGVTTAAINQHLINIFDDQELQEEATIKKNLIVRLEGNRKVSRNVLMYNLDAILSVGYRISSKQATQFRIWASRILKQYQALTATAQREGGHVGVPPGKEFRYLLGN